MTHEPPCRRRWTSYEASPDVIVARRRSAPVQRTFAARLPRALETLVRLAFGALRSGPLMNTTVQ
ncbi:MAG: hypothetical protein R3C32_08285 [Chloroflexota bacterium]